MCSVYMRELVKMSLLRYLKPANVHMTLGDRCLTTAIAGISRIITFSYAFQLLANSSSPYVLTHMVASHTRLQLKCS